MIDRQTLALGKQVASLVCVLVIVGVLIWSSSVGTPRNKPHDLTTRFAGYYSRINPNSPTLRSDLTTLIYPRPTVLTYSQVWSAYNRTDNDDFECKEASCPLKCLPTDLVDMYSANCWHFSSDQCGNYHKEGDCYNREHSWPKSWWGGSHATNTPYTDLHHLVPTDGKVNAMRSNWPYGIVHGMPSYESSNHAKLGTCTAADNYGYSGTCFEPPDMYKGDLARGYFYIATAYADALRDRCSTCSTTAVHGARLAPWQDKLLRDWHAADPVSAKEVERNDAIQAQQGNRNPFVDFPHWINRVDLQSGPAASPKASDPSTPSTSPPNLPGGTCVRGKRGPACGRRRSNFQDINCGSHSGCLRCAKSGYCTAEPLGGK